MTWDTMISPADGIGRTPAEQLQEQISKLSRAMTLNEVKSTLLHLFVRDVDINPQLLRLLVEFLNIPSQKYDGTAFKWSLCFVRCNFIPEEARGEQNCTTDEIHGLVEALATQTQYLHFEESQGVVQHLLITHRLEISCLEVHDCDQLSDMDYARLRNLLQVSPNLKHLDIAVPIDAPEQVAAVVVSAMDLESLTLHEERKIDTTREQNQQFLSEIVVGEGGHQALARLLRDPRSRLNDLRLDCKSLDDDLFIAILNLLPTSRLKVLKVSCKIQYRGIMEFARCLPHIKCLKWLFLCCHPSLSVTEKTQCDEALLQGIMQNTSLEYCGSFLEFRQCPLFRYYLILNHAGRKILSASQPVPLGLWSFVLQRAGTTISYDIHDVSPRADAIFYFLRNSPIMSHIIHL